ncbi:hypothetical protein HZA97_07930 [Candidatus Woesearchaeota archaeon]|nr:hypothetical protein [Candidatus Woesearchaeota archaeon]
MNDLDQKLKQYETTAVDVTNKMYDPNLRTESSKEVLENFPNVRLASEKQENKAVIGRKGINFLSALFLSAGIGIGGYFVGNYQGKHHGFEKGQEILLREITRNYFDSKTRSYLGHERFYTKIMSPAILGREPTSKEFDIILDEVLNTIVPESGLPLREHITESSKHGYFYFGGVKK